MWGGGGSPTPLPPINSNTQTAAGHVWYIKLPVYLLFYMELGLNDFDESKSIIRAIGRGRPWKSRLFWALKWPRAKRVPKHQNHFVPPHINNRYINSYILLLKFERRTERTTTPNTCWWAALSVKSFLLISPPYNSWLVSCLMCKTETRNLSPLRFPSTISPSGAIFIQGTGDIL